MRRIAMHHDHKVTVRTGRQIALADRPSRDGRLPRGYRALHHDEDLPQSKAVVMTISGRIPEPCRIEVGTSVMAVGRTDCTVQRPFGTAAVSFNNAPLPCRSQRRPLHPTVARARSGCTCALSCGQTPSLARAFLANQATRAFTLQRR